MRQRLKPVLVVEMLVAMLIEEYLTEIRHAVVATMTRLDPAIEAELT